MLEKDGRVAVGGALEGQSIGVKKNYPLGQHLSVLELIA
jgi:hypothetical protein